jgi:hypothetical protein
MSLDHGSRREDGEYRYSGNNMIKEMSTKEKEVKAKEFWEYYETTQGTITITDPVVLD